MKKRFSKSKDGIPLLQGELYIHIYEAKDLPDMDGKYSFTNPKYYKKIIFIVHVKGSEFIGNVEIPSEKLLHGNAYQTIL